MRSIRRPKLGQHFLTSDRYRRRIAEALTIRRDDLVIEIGPGRGAMTGLLAGHAARVVAIEIDSGLARHLEEVFPAGGDVDVLQGDILEVNIGELCWSRHVERAFVFGNVPYYITSPILHHLLEFPDRIRAMALVVQLEVAERITAQPGSRAYGYLSVLAQLHSTAQLHFRIPPGAFTPPPAVDSALVTFETKPLPKGWDESRGRAFLDFVKRSFGQKRKKLANNLAGAYAASDMRQCFHALGCNDNVRAEQLSVAELAGLFTALRRP